MMRPKTKAKILRKAMCDLSEFVECEIDLTGERRAKVLLKRVFRNLKLVHDSLKDESEQSCPRNIGD